MKTSQTSQQKNTQKRSRDKKRGLQQMHFKSIPLASISVSRKETMEEVLGSRHWPRRGKDSPGTGHELDEPDIVGKN